MKPVAFEGLARLPVIEFYETAFRKATGVSLRLVPPAANGQPREFGAGENPFCVWVARSPLACEACREAETRAQQSVAAKRSSQQFHCYAGLTVLAVPVMVNGEHVATLLSGQVFRREPTDRDFQMVLKMMGHEPGEEWSKAARKHYFETPVLTAERFQAAFQLLEVFAHYLSEVASRQVVARSSEDPEAVASAKEFVQAHVEEPITLDQVVDHVHVSRFYFCKLFKKATGMTLTEYVTRVRVEKAKGLLDDPARRVSEVVFAAGFGSIPRFNSAFKEMVGMSPTEYRAKVQSGKPG
jgi:AraC-like DNA-binding protein/ligand-binding sensor protein